MKEETHESTHHGQREVGITPEGRAKSEKLVHGMLLSLAKDLGLEIPKDRLPALKILPNKTPGRIDFSVNPFEYDMVKNAIVCHIGVSLLNTPLEKYAGNVFGEEIGHFFRSYFTNTIGSASRFHDVHEMTTQEFYGYITRKLFLRWAKKINIADHFFVDGAMHARPERTQSLAEIKERKEQLHHMSRWIRGIARLAQHNERVSTISHDRGYRWGDQVDIEKIKDWKKFYSLSVDEARKRFFREDKDYSDLGNEEHQRSARVVEKSQQAAQLS